eukprot:gene5704-6589_t
MVRLSVSITAETEEVVNIFPDDHKIWFFKLKCSHCLTVTDNWIGIDPEEAIEIGKSVVNLQMKCRTCARENTVTIEDKLNINDRQCESETAMVMKHFDCRGVELEEFDPRDVWIEDEDVKLNIPVHLITLAKLIGTVSISGTFYKAVLIRFGVILGRVNDAVEVSKKNNFNEKDSE